MATGEVIVIGKAMVTGEEIYGVFRHSLMVVMYIALLLSLAI